MVSTVFQSVNRYFVYAVIGFFNIVFSTSSFAVCAEIFDHKMRQLHSQNQIDICQLVDQKPALVINTASHCGFTRQFKGLEKLHQQYSDSGLVVLGFASDDFNQEDKDESKAADICYVNYGVTFTMLAPSSVKGKQANPVFQGLNEQAKSPSWNFNKYLVDKQGKVVKHFGSRVSPESKELVQAIESVL
ncbi:MAG: glutathione peroxidase [Actinobacteria bacterium TMED172]|nr:glutathione peroxidase [Cellvibrionales bacterium]OUW33335.1 MAG: glutathione peroxidase [Actinobacteria bacterium TMED172]|tara:strand:- start:779 stop:1345 length:567 start_codon:yes stop_codon:yes gene_type:complete